MITVPLLGIPLQALLGQLLIGLINGSFYALLSLGVAVIFGLLNIVNFAHGAQYMLGAFVAYFLLKLTGIGYWGALVIAPLVVGAVGLAIEQLLLKRLYKLDHLYGMVLTLGLAMVLEGVFRHFFGAAGLPYGIPAALQGAQNLGFMYLPVYRGWVIVASLVVCLSTWFLIEKTPLGATLRAATENRVLVEAFGINVPRMVMLTYGFGVALAALAGVMAAPIYQVSPLMGTNVIVVVFAVVVIGGMGSILGAILSGFALGLVEGLTKVIYPQAASTVVFVVMAIVLLTRPAGFLGRTQAASTNSFLADAVSFGGQRWTRPVEIALLAFACVAPFLIYPLFLSKVLCFALFGAAFALLAGHVGLLSFGHAAFFGAAAYVTAYSAKAWALPPELAILLGTGTAALIGLVFGWLAIRRSGIYFAMVTLALSQLIFFVALQAKWTGGEDGIQAVPRGRLFGIVDLEQPLAIYFFTLAVFVACFLLIRRITNSPFGQVLKATAQNEPRVVSLGYRVQRAKLIAFVLSATLAGLAGSMKALVVKLASLADVHWSMSGEVLLIGLIGGLGSLLGPVFGSFLLIGIGDYLAAVGAWVTVLQGLIFIACVLLFRRGLVGGLDDLFAWLKRRGQTQCNGALTPRPMPGE